jgi:hypothetical protein
MAVVTTAALVRVIRCIEDPSECWLGRFSPARALEVKRANVRWPYAQPADRLGHPHT